MNNNPYVNMKYMVEGVEDIYDAFDEFEHSNRLEPVVVEASSLEAAITTAKNIFQSQINQERFKSGFVSSPDSAGGPHGMYLARVEKISDGKEKVLYENEEKRVW